jgi:aminoglycoside phosphotransferase (APT) family kinase protein
MARATAPRTLATALARLHCLDTASGVLGALPRMGDPPAQATVRHYQELFHRVALEPRPVIELAFRWLFRHLPPDGHHSVVHGDFRVGNFLYDETGLRAIVDWEIAHVGHPMEDISWLCLRTWRFGVDQLEVGGLCRREEFLQQYENAGGPAVDRGTLHFWEVFANVRWAVITIAQTRNHLDGYIRDVELAAIGRRAAENELDLLALIG